MWRRKLIHKYTNIYILYKIYIVKATCIWKFVQCHFKASKLSAGCGGYLEKIYKILIHILDLKTGFPFANFFIQSNFFRSKTIKSRIGSWVLPLLLVRQCSKLSSCAISRKTYESNFKKLWSRFRPPKSFYRFYLY